MQYRPNTIKIEAIKTISVNDDLSISDKLFNLIKLFKINSLCLKNGLTKHNGFAGSEILTVLILFPFMAISTVNSFFTSRFNQLTNAKKDTFFRLNNNEYFNCRNLLYLFAKRFKRLSHRNINKAVEHYSDEVAETPKCLIIDDTVINKTGMRIEFIGKVFDHVIGKLVLGFKLLLLSYWDGNSLIPLDFSYHNEKGRNKKYPFGLLKRQLKNRFSRQRDKKSAGYKRSQELFVDKITNAIAMLKRAVKHGFIPDYALSDSWFSSEQMIQTIRKIKNGIIHFLGMVKMDKRLYDYQGQKLNARELKKRLKSKMKRARKLNIYYIKVIVNYSDIGLVKLFFTRFSKRSKWRLLLTTDLDLSFQQAIKIYNIRWSIEVLFKECKQLLNLGKSQSDDLDAQIADATISLIVYTMLSFHKRSHSHTSLGALFAQYRDDFIEATVAEKLWQLFLTIQLTIAEIFGIDYAKMMRVVFELPEVANTLKSLSEILFEDNFASEFKKVA